jgi:hypothetical protein
MPPGKVCCTLQETVINVYGAGWNNDYKGTIKELREEPVPVPSDPQQVLYEFTQD